MNKPNYYWPLTAGVALQDETLTALRKLPHDVVAAQSMSLGFRQGEPLLLALDGLLRYAKAYKTRYESDLADDYVLGDHWVDAIKGIHGLLDGDGAVAMEQKINSDSKCNGVLEEIYQAALATAGFDSQGDRKDEQFSSKSSSS
jgi:hypothetical protein